MLTKLQVPPQSSSIKNLSYRESHVTGLRKTTNTPTVLKLFTERVIQADKSVKLYFIIPVRKDLTDAGAINIGTNVKVNGTWFSLGTSGIANNLSLAGDKFIGTYTNTKVLHITNLIRDCGVVAGSTYRLWKII
jgi:hypothetical protein